jgi:transcription-repair coupling factor (superfamily II helicase)
MPWPWRRKTRRTLARIAIEKELAREGQAFYLHNRVETIDQAAEHVRALVPEMHKRKLFTAR